MKIMAIVGLFSIIVSLLFACSDGALVVKASLSDFFTVLFLGIGLGIGLSFLFLAMEIKER